MLNAITLHPGDRVALDPVLRSNAARCDQDRAPHEHPGHHCERHLEQVAKEVGNVAAGFFDGEPRAWFLPSVQLMLLWRVNLTIGECTVVHCVVLRRRGRLPTTRICAELISRTMPSLHHLETYDSAAVHRVSARSDARSLHSPSTRPIRFRSCPVCSAGYGCSPRPATLTHRSGHGDRSRVWDADRDG
jgi:hypothetical protein